MSYMCSWSPVSMKGNSDLSVFEQVHLRRQRRQHSRRTPHAKRARRLALQATAARPRRSRKAAGRWDPPWQARRTRFQGSAVATAATQRRSSRRSWWAPQCWRLRGWSQWPATSPATRAPRRSSRRRLPRLRLLYQIPGLVRTPLLLCLITLPRSCDVGFHAERRFTCRFLCPLRERAQRSEKRHRAD